MNNERGFTLPELIVVTVALLLGLIGTLLILRPATFDEQETAAARRLGNAQVMQALREYKQDKGSLPAGFPTELTPIASIEDGYDLCSILVPTYLKDLPFDPGIGYKAIGDDETVTDTCANKEVEYVTGYFISKNASNTVTITVVDSVTGLQQKLVQKL